jgi:hypothetical protein
MKKIFLLLLPFAISCATNTSPITGSYESEDKKFSATVLDSTLYFMLSPDSAVIYNLKLHNQLKLTDSTTIRIYNVLYSDCLTIDGYESFEVPLKFKYSSNFGGTLIAIFENDDSFMIGGISFLKPEPATEHKIFNNLINLLNNNFQTQLLMKYQDDE